jgi:hypothetical protein
MRLRTQYATFSEHYLAAYDFPALSQRWLTKHDSYTGEYPSPLLTVPPGWLPASFNSSAGGALAVSKRGVSATAANGTVLWDNVFYGRFAYVGAYALVPPAPGVDGSGFLAALTADSNNMGYVALFNSTGAIVATVSLWLAIERYYGANLVLDGDGATLYASGFCSQGACQPSIITLHVDTKHGGNLTLLGSAQVANATYEGQLVVGPRKGELAWVDWNGMYVFA